MRGRRNILGRFSLLSLMAGAAIATQAPALLAGTPPQTDTPAIIIDPAVIGPKFRPDTAFGAGYDGTSKGAVDKQLTPHNIAAMRSAGLRPLSYRLRTELGIEVWHWNPRGTWSDPAHAQGYWTSSDTPTKPIRLSWGYRLPRRGDTDDNANNNDYSRLTDGDPARFWKSNPYLDPAFLRDGSAHPQWLILRFDQPTPVDTAEIRWAAPYATAYEVQYWTGKADWDRKGIWATFPGGRVDRGAGGDARLHLSDQPVTATYLRVLLKSGSGTAPAGHSDPRDRAGFAIREVGFGLTRADGGFDDAVHHRPDKRQTFTHVSSTDPWHRASDRDTGLEQVGIDRIFRGGLGNGLPIMMPTGLLVDTPENMAAELRYIARRGYPVRQIELGEEPDGQFGNPDDYGALYLAAVDRLRGIIPGATFGGPSLQSAFSENTLLPDQWESWNYWFMQYLKRRDRLADLGFLTFEYYPFDDICGDIHAKLIAQSRMIDDIMQRFDADGVPRSVPRIMAEYGFSAFSGRAMSEMPSALLMAEINAHWLNIGGNAAYLFGYPPNSPINQHQPCAGFGNMMLHLGNQRGQAGAQMPSYHTARLLTQEWTMPGDRIHQMIGARVEGVAGGAVLAYALRRPDGRIAVLLINRSAGDSYTLPLRIAGAPTAAPLRLVTYGSAQYRWIDAGKRSRPAYSQPPVAQTLAAGAPVILPPDSLAVVVIPAR